MKNFWHRLFLLTKVLNEKCRSPSRIERKQIFPCNTVVFQIHLWSCGHQQFSRLVAQRHSLQPATLLPHSWRNAGHRPGVDLRLESGYKEEIFGFQLLERLSQIQLQCKGSNDFCSSLTLAFVGGSLHRRDLQVSSGGASTRLPSGPSGKENDWKRPEASNLDGIRWHFPHRERFRVLRVHWRQLQLKYVVFKAFSSLTLN